MAEKPIWEQIGSGFVQHYYQQFDTDRVKLADLYTDASCLTWEGEGFQGKTAIMTKLSSLPFQSIQHSITAQDHHPTPDSCVMSMVMGQLKDIQNVDEFVFPSEQIWRDLALHHLLTNRSSAVNGCRHNKSPNSC
uniref:NTF2-related export protein n=1 Tax=Cyprinus carpio carpio TaxID=630221 RepID=A0A8C1BVP5_CYPCA